MKATGPEQLWLTSTGRLARSRIRDCRKILLRQGRSGWERPDILSLKAWLDREWIDSWPETFPAPDLQRMGIWKTIIETLPPPKPLEGGASLCRMLDDTFGVLVRHAINPSSGPESTTLVDWRRKACEIFAARLSKAGLFHPDELPLFVAEGLRNGAIIPPKEHAVLGFEFPSPLEQELFTLLDGLSQRIPDPLEKGEPGRVSAVTLPTPEQEILYLCRCLAEDAQSVPLHRIGVVVPNLATSARILESTLEDVLGLSGPGGETWFNITLGPSLSTLPLFTASLLPLRFFLEGESRETFLTMILSPYYGLWRGERAGLARADRIWRSKGIDGNLAALRRSLMNAPEELRGGIFREGWEILHDLRRALSRGKQPLSFWADRMEDIWKVFGFPVMADEEDQLAWRHLADILRDFRSHMGNSLFTGSEFVEWLNHRASLETTQPERPEDAGIQIMGIIEARGLTFDRLYVTNMNEGSLPQPTRPLPLLDSSERTRVQGGTAESQMAFADAAFTRLVRSAPSVTFLRAEQEGATPLNPSPLWPEDALTADCNIWIDPDPGLMRTPWLRAAWKGFLSTEPLGMEQDPGIDNPFAIPEAFREKLFRGLSPSGLKKALTCPFMFMVNSLLKVEPLDEITSPPTPLERGNRIHSIFALYTKRLRSAGIETWDNRDEVLHLLRECVREILGHDADQTHWRLETDRLLGTTESEYPGLLPSWLEQEEVHRARGWRCVGEEQAFSDLHVPGCPFPLSGRIDRIDYNAIEGWACFDYKTGKIPSRNDVCNRFVEPQLPIYLMAMRDGRIQGLSNPSRMALSGGYIQIKSLNDLKYRFLADLTDSIPLWETIIADMGTRLAEGLFDPLPFPLSPSVNREKVCRECAFRTLCVQGLKAEPDLAEGDSDEIREDSHDD